MKRLLNSTYTLLCCLVLALPAMAQGTKSFEIFENFDDASHFADGNDVPEGWHTEGTYAFSRMLGVDNGIMAYSGSYIFSTIGNSASATRNEKIYTPMMHLAAARPCTISFYLYAPGGTPSFVRNNKIVVNANTAQDDGATIACCGETEQKAYGEWTPCTFTFTPDTEGDYCFELELQTTLPSSGSVSLDDVCIEGEMPEGTGTDPEEPTLEPDPENEADALMPPYLESFDNENDNYTGDSYVPQHWFSTGSVPFITANVASLPAHTGTYYAIAPGDGTTTRDERLYTPFFMLEAGKEYTISAYVHIERGTTGITAAIDITAGTQQEGDFHTSLLKIADHANDGWELVEAHFTPEKAGAYCFSFAVSCPEIMSGFIAIDDVLVTAKDLVLKPKADFRISHLYDLLTGDMVVYEGQAIELHNFSEYATDYEWSATGRNCTLSDTHAKNPTITFGESGTYTITLKASNSTGERTSVQEVAVDYVDYTKSGCGLTPTAADDAYYSREDLPAFDTDERDYITGPNHYYRRMAERMAFGEGTATEITNINVVLTHLNYKMTNSGRDEQFAAKFSVVVYGETDGMLDESKVFGRYDGTLSDALGTSGIGIGYGEPRDIIFPSPVTVTGPCYIALEFGDDVDISIQAPVAGRTYVGFQAVRHASKCTTLLACPTALPATSSAKAGQWTALENIDPTFTGYGLWLLAWVNTGKTVGIALDTAGNTVLAARSTADGIDVSGTESGKRVNVYNAAGQLVATTIAQGGSTHLKLGSSAHGTLLVSTTSGTVKVTRE